MGGNDHEENTNIVAMSFTYGLNHGLWCTQSIKPIDTIEGNMKTYSEMSDGTWQCDGHIYKYRLEISGRLSNAVKDSTYIYLSNIEDITFEQAWKASGLSSNMDDYFDIDEAVLVELPDRQLPVCRTDPQQTAVVRRTP